MFPEKLPDAERYRFTSAEIFGEKSPPVRGFTERNYSFDMHCQEFFEINIVLGGSGMHYVGDGRIAVSRGDVFIIPPNLRHGYRGNVGFDIYHLLLSPTFFEKYSADLRLLPAFSAMFHVEPAMRERYFADLHLKLGDRATDELTPALSDITRHSQKNAPENVIIAMCRSMILIATLCAEYESSIKSRESVTSQSGDEAFMRSIARIYEAYSEKLTIEELSSIARMSRSAYLRRFKEFTGTSPGEYILKRRIETAANMLEHTSASITDIAAASGFYDAPHLIRSFKSRYGMSPMEYRQTSSKRG